MPPGTTELVPLLTGATGGLVLSLLLNWLQFRGRLVNPKAVVPREDYDAALLIAERNTVALEKLTTRGRRP